MTFTAIVSGLFAIAKAVPYVYRLIDSLSNLLLEQRIKDLDIARVTLQDKRDAIIKAISKAETNEELLALSAALHDVNNGGLRE